MKRNLSYDFNIKNWTKHLEEEENKPLLFEEGDLDFVLTKKMKGMKRGYKGTNEDVLTKKGVKWDAIKNHAAKIEKKEKEID